MGSRNAGRLRTALMVLLALLVLVAGCTLPGVAPAETDAPGVTAEGAEPTAMQSVPTATEPAAVPTATAGTPTEPPATDAPAAADVPDLAGSYGWLYRGTYTSVQGEASALAVMTADPAIPAYLRNRTFHPMRILPGDFILAEQFDAANNEHQVNPGSYEAYDLNVEGDPLVFSQELREGQTVEILTDGLHNSYSCPG
uniref:Uncharacterized protein n=1 Tax=uncultured Chloroflexi bacterium Rifle_16ft_4_minimus_450 TaxID=1665075 RepID=A0A0H4TTM2_9CHLR|nr:hypothetical protein [uncultured Chloroflexi bacterium Rifle_16ft_4_minimus_450]